MFSDLTESCKMARTGVESGFGKDFPQILENQMEKRMEHGMETGSRGIPLTMEHQTEEKTEYEMENGVM